MHLPINCTVSFYQGDSIKRLLTRRVLFLVMSWLFPGQTECWQRGGVNVLIIFRRKAICCWALTFSPAMPWNVRIAPLGLYSTKYLQCVQIQCMPVARVNVGSHAFNPQVEWVLHASISQPQSITAFLLLLISHPVGRVVVEGWLGSNCRCNMLPCGPCPCGAKTSKSRRSTSVTTLFGRYHRRERQLRFLPYVCRPV